MSQETCGTSADKGANSILVYVTFIIIVFSSVFFPPGLNQLQAARGGKRGVNMNPIVLLMCAGSPGASVLDSCSYTVQPLLCMHCSAHMLYVSTFLIFLLCF